MSESNDYFIKKILRKYLVPTILTLLGTTVASFANNILAGRLLGRDALTSMNIVSSFSFLFAMLGCLISIGGASCASIAIGRQEREKADACATLALVFSIAVPLLISIPLLIFQEFLPHDRGGHISISLLRRLRSSRLRWSMSLYIIT